jgi:hypothetical protein
MSVACFADQHAPRALNPLPGSAAAGVEVARKRALHHLVVLLARVLGWLLKNKAVPLELEFFFNQASAYKTQCEHGQPPEADAAARADFAMQAVVRRVAEHAGPDVSSQDFVAAIDFCVERAPFLAPYLDMFLMALRIDNPSLTSTRDAEVRDPRANVTMLSQ